MRVLLEHRGMSARTGINEKQNKESGVKRVLGFDREQRGLEWKVVTVELDPGKKSSIKPKPGKASKGPQLMTQSAHSFRTLPH